MDLSGQRLLLTEAKAKCGLRQKGQGERDHSGCSCPSRRGSRALRKVSRSLGPFPEERDSQRPATTRLPGEVATRVGAVKGGRGLVWPCSGPVLQPLFFPRVPLPLHMPFCAPSTLQNSPLTATSWLYQQPYPVGMCPLGTRAGARISPLFLQGAPVVCRSRPLSMQ